MNALPQITAPTPVARSNALTILQREWAAKAEAEARIDAQVGPNPMAHHKAGRSQAGMTGGLQAMAYAFGTSNAKEHAGMHLTRAKRDRFWARFYEAPGPCHNLAAARRSRNSAAANLTQAGVWRRSIGAAPKITVVNAQ